MGRFNIFNNQNESNENDALMKEKSFEIKDFDEKNQSGFEDVKDGYILTQTRCSELLERIFTDKDHGESMMKEVELSENIFVLGYIENVLIPECQEKKDEKKLVWLKSVMTIFRKIFCAKVMKEDKLYKVVLKTTGFPFMDNGCEHILICEQYKDKIF